MDVKVVWAADDLAIGELLGDVKPCRAISGHLEAAIESHETYLARPALCRSIGLAMIPMCCV